ncbi:DNA mismatch repair protein [Ekhidna sp. MALMAid0563]|uniref:MutS-related protein n=1 Tax=Ekhidna sp. MALMAid0563 TaxID=3143937 RepID=UPI0032DF6E88
MTQLSARLSVSDRRISLSRFLSISAAAFLFYQYYQTSNILFLLAGMITATSFFLLIRKHKSIRWENELAKAKIEINQDEKDFLASGKLDFDSGEEFIQHDHPYSYDLDFFGENSLFQTLNRTATTYGKQRLAKKLLHIQSKEEILQIHEAVQELTPNTEWRHQILALGKLKPDSQESNKQLLDWANRKPRKFNSVIRALTFVLPALTIGALSLYFIYPEDIFGNIGGLLFLINLAFLASHMLWIKEELIPTTKIEEILKQHSFLLKEIENQTFQSDKLKNLQFHLASNHTKASEAIHHLSLLFGRLEHVTNVFASPLLNGTLQYHLHVLYALSKWRSKHATHLEGWLKVIGEFEAISSLSNFSYNNPGFVFPTINNEKRIQFENLGHPLISKDKSVTNSIDFNTQSFFILTGSNMSGKSTFLRTVGVNMVLSGIGAPVYAEKATVHPMPVFVSMRLSDSLTDSESYFYAEVKRLKYIMEQLDNGDAFVLLDEILRGTNSDDKRNGTIEVIRKMAEKNAFGGIATHDLEVCNITHDYSKTLTNKRFEVEIVNDELVFDYKLRDGVCENKSASFIMKKMGVI